MKAFVIKPSVSDDRLWHVKKRADTTFNDFADLKKVLTQAAKQAEKLSQAQAQATANKALVANENGQDKACFLQYVDKVTRLQTNDRVQHQPRRAPAQPFSRQADDKAVLTQAMSDEFDVSTLLETDDTLAFRRPDIGPDILRKLRRGVWTLQAQLDLHGMRTHEAREALGHFLKDAQFRGWRCVRVVHGKGLGSPGRVPVIKEKVKSWLVQNNRVLAFVQARAAEGGAGALIVLLQSAKL